MLAPAISIKHLSVKFDGKWLFKDQSLFLPAGKLTCLLGASGIGKSTLIRLIADLSLTESYFPSVFPHFSNAKKQKKSFAQTSRLTAKNYYHAEVTANDQRSVSDRVSYMSQSNMLLPWCTVEQNVFLGYTLRQKKPSLALKKRFESLLISFGLDGHQKSKPYKLSGGMRQRVILLRVLIEDQPILLLDEPFFALDTITRYKIHQLVAEYFQQKTVLMVTHDPWEALSLADKIVVLKGQPAVFSEPIFPPGLAPRDMTSEISLLLREQLMLLLSER